VNEIFMEQWLYDPFFWSLVAGLPTVGVSAFLAGRGKKAKSAQVVATTRATVNPESEQAVGEIEVLEALAKAGLNEVGAAALKTEIKTVQQLKTVVHQIGHNAYTKLFERILPLANEYVRTLSADQRSTVQPSDRSWVIQHAAMARAIVCAQLVAPKGAVHPAFASVAQDFSMLTDELRESLAKTISENFMLSSRGSGPWVDSKMLETAREEDRVRSIGRHYRYDTRTLEPGYSDFITPTDEGRISVDRHTYYGGYSFTSSTWHVMSFDPAKTEAERKFWSEVVKAQLKHCMGSDTRNFTSYFGANALTCGRFIEVLQSKSVEAAQ
jgi:hypothetical protein